MVDHEVSTTLDGFRSTLVDMETLGKRLKAARLAAGLTQEQLGKIAGVSKQAVSQIENGTTQNPESKTLDPICRVLKLNTHYVLTGRGTKSASADDHARQIEQAVSALYSVMLKFRRHEVPSLLQELAQDIEAAGPDSFLSALAAGLQAGEALPLASQTPNP